MTEAGTRGLLFDEGKNMTISEIYTLTSNHLRMMQGLIDVYTEQGDIAARTSCQQDVVDTQTALAQLQSLLPPAPPAPIAPIAPNDSEG